MTYGAMKKNYKFPIPTIHGYRFISYDDILYFHADRNYTKLILTSGKKITISRNLGSIEEDVPHHDFYRVHQSYFVNLMYVEEFRKGDPAKLILSDGFEVPVSRTQKKALLKLLIR
jgi:two-component system LytT family response regulator